MTNKDAISILQTIRKYPSTDYQLSEVYEMAIQALSQEPNDDIYRKAWLELDRLIGKAPKPNLPKNMIESDSIILKRIRDLFWEVSRVLFYKTDYEPFLQEPCEDDRK